MEENSDFEEIRADDGQSSNALTIRQNVPSKSSSADKPPATSQTPLGAAHLDPTWNAALNPHRNIRRTAIVEMRHPKTAKWRRAAS
jgi:hypothetical protein